MQFHGASQRCSSTARHNGAVPRRVTTVMYYDVIPQPTSGNILTQYRHPRVQHDTLGQHFRAFPLPKGAGQNEVWMKETLRQRKPYLSLPEGTARLSWATLSYFIVARGYSTALLGNTFVHLRCPSVQRGALERHLRAFPPPNNSGTIPTATFCAIFVTQGFRHLFLTQVSHLRNTTLLHCLQ